MIWNINYYVTGIVDWSWNYPFLYGPFLSDLKDTKVLMNFKSGTTPSHPFVQLMSILPPQSKHLLPIQLQSIYTKELAPFCPKTFKIDNSGKKNEWEAIAEIPFMDQNIVRMTYCLYSDILKQSDLERNKVGISEIFYNNKNGLTIRKPIVL